MAANPVGLGYDQTAALKFSRRLSAALRRITEATAAYAGFGFGVEFAGNTEWLCRHEGCVCTDIPVPAANDPPGVARLEVFHCAIPAGSVLLCTSRGKNSLIPIVGNLIKESIHQVELEFEDEDLIRELGSNWESLHMLYEISSDLRASRNIPDILSGIMDRIVSGRPSLHAVLWIEKDGRLEPAITRQVEVTRSRSVNSGILGRAAISRIPVVINDRSKTRIDAELEAELLNAEKIALVPIASRDRLVGVLEVWQEDASGEFDAPTIRLFEALALQAAMVLEGERAYRISIAEERLRKEVEIGGRIQETLLLGRPPAALSGIRIGVLTVPSRAVDGDFFDFLSCGEDCLDMFVGDVMGKGIPAALVGAAAKSDLLKAFGQLTADNRIRRLPEPQDIVTAVHQHLTAKLIRIESFISLYYSRFDLRNRQLIFVDCGHPQAIHYRADRGTLELLAGDNMPRHYRRGQLFPGHHVLPSGRYLLILLGRCYGCL